MAKERLREVEQIAQKNTTTMKTAQPQQQTTRKPSPEMIAEAAYYKAEKRGFTPGMELHDWLEAEKEIQERGTTH